MTTTMHPTASDGNPGQAGATAGRWADGTI